MDCTATHLPYRETKHFSKIILDYIDQAESIRPFYHLFPSIQEIQKAIEQRKQFATDRKTLVAELKKQYQNITTDSSVQKNIDALLSEDTFTITTAHQTNLFTGPLYFIYKIAHVIKLAQTLKAEFPTQHFVPVFYIGSEDADLDELNHIWVGGEQYVWNTKQKGAVGRMKSDKELIKLIDHLSGQLNVLPYGIEIIQKLKEFYKEGNSIQDAIFYLVNYLFAEYGLVVLLPDNAALKHSMASVFEDDLFQHTASKIVGATATQLIDAGYKEQAHTRAINLFYLKDNIRERIERKEDLFYVVNTDIVFDISSLQAELKNHPERFSPNVILRGLYQETILPNIIFVGGGGEMAYWLQLKSLFKSYKVPFPVLTLRNSFLFIEQKWLKKIAHLDLTPVDFFNSETDLLNRKIKLESNKELSVQKTITALTKSYNDLRKQATDIDKSIERHVEALKVQAISRVTELEKKMLRAEKRKYTDLQNQINKIYTHLFPNNGLQERKDNLLYYYAKWGRSFIGTVIKNSNSIEPDFTILMEHG